MLVEGMVCNCVVYRDEVGFNLNYIKSKLLLLRIIARLGAF